MRIAPPSLLPHHSDPAARDFQSSIPVEALLRGCHLDVQCLLQQQFLSSAAVQYSRRHPGVPSALSHVAGMSEDIRRVCRKFNIRVVFKSGQTLCSMLTKVKDIHYLLVNNPMWYIVSPAAAARSTSGRPNGDWRQG